MKNLSLLFIAAALLASCTKAEQEPPIEGGGGKAETIATIVSGIFVGGDGAESVDGTGKAARFHTLIKLTSDKAGNLYVLESPKTGGQTFKIRKVTTGGVTSTLFNGDDPAVLKGRTYKIFDIATGADGTVYAMAYMTNLSIAYRTGTGTDAPVKYYQEYGAYKVSGDSLAKVSVSSLITSLGGDKSWVAAHHMLTNIAVDASGELYGAISASVTEGVAKGTKVYKISGTPGLISGNTDAVLPTTLIGDAAGTLYASTATDVLKITTAGVSKVFTFPTVKSTFKPKLAGSQSGNLYVYGDVYNNLNEFKGTGFYTLKSDGTTLDKGVFPTAPTITAATVNASSVFYYAVELKKDGGYANGYVIYKSSFD